MRKTNYLRKRTMSQTALLCLLSLMLMLSACLPQAGQTSQAITIGLPALEQNALIYIAEAQGYFKQNGLAVTIQDYDSGVTALNALLDQQAVFAVAAEFPVTRAALDGKPVTIVAGIDQFENDYIVARKDRGIATIADLKGKRIGVALQTINEFYLGRFLELHRLSLKDVTLVALKPAQFVPALVSGEVDALIAWQPYIDQAQQQLPELVTWPAQSSQSVYGLLAARRDWVAQNPQTVTRLLNALIQAEEYLSHHPAEAQAIVQKRLNYTGEYVAKIWSSHEFSVTLDSSLLVAMTDEARWLIRNGLTTQKQPPDFNAFFYPDGLKGLKPEAVDIHP